MAGRSRVCLAGGAKRAQALRLAAAGKAWEEIDEFDLDEDDVTTELKKPSDKVGPTGVGTLENFDEGADFAKAKAFAATRTFAVAPWHEDVKAKPIFAVSDSTGKAASRLVKCAFQQFGPGSLCKLTVYPEMVTEDDVRKVGLDAAKLAPKKALAIERKGAMLVYTLADRAKGVMLADEAVKQGAPCINALEPVLASMERRFGLARQVTSSGDDQSGMQEQGLTVFAVSDNTGESAHEIVLAGLKQFPACGVDTVTVCPEVSTLEEVNHIVTEALALDSMIVFTFASPGMSRFMRQQCERSKVPYADAFQPILIAFEKYLDYPPVGVAGGHDLKASESTRLRWQRHKMVKPGVRAQDDDDDDDSDDEEE